MNAVLIMQSGNKFFAKPHTVGTTEEELAAIKAGTIDESRRYEVQVNLMRSALELELTAKGSKN